MNRPRSSTTTLVAASFLVLLGGLGSTACREARRDVTPGTAPESLPPASPPADTDPSAPPPIAPPTDTRPEIPADVPTHLGAPGDGTIPPELSDVEGEADVEEGAMLAPDSPAWGPPLSPAQAQALDRYAAFSQDGLVYAFVEEQDGIRTLHYVAVPTETVEKIAPLLTLDVRNHVAAELAAEGFPAPGEPASTPGGAIPGGMEAVVRGEEVHVVFAGMPAGRPFRAFEDRHGVSPTSASLVAVSPDGDVAAVRVGSKAGEVEHRLVRLFE